MNNLATLIEFVNELKNNEHSALRKCMESSDLSVNKMMPYLIKIDLFEDIERVLSIFQEVLEHLKVDVDTSDHDYCDIIVGVDYKLEFDNEDPKDFNKALELLEWFDNEQVYPEDMEDEE